VTPVNPALTAQEARYQVADAGATLVVADGTGAALLAVMLNANFVSPVFLYLVWRGPLCLQGSQDPTNSWTLWTIGYTKVSHPDFLKTALPWGWLMVAINAFIAYFLFGGMFGG